MNNRFITTLLTLIAVVASSVNISAQANIDRLVRDLEKEQNVQVTYTEHRNPKTKKIIKQNTILNGNSESQARKLWKAFESERQNSVKVTKTRDTSFIITFQDSKYKSNYVLSVNGTSWSLVITKREPSDRDDISYNVDIDFGDLDNLCFNGGELNLEQLKLLDGLKSLSNININNIDGDVTVYDGEGNVIYKSKSTKSGKLVKSKSMSTSTKIRRSGRRTVTTYTTTNDNGTTVSVSTI